MSNINLDLLKYIEDVLLPKKVAIGMTADDVLKLHPKKEMTRKPEVVGKDVDGLIVWWHYPDFKLKMEYVSNDEISAYAVQEIVYNEDNKDDTTPDD